MSVSSMAALAVRGAEEHRILEPRPGVAAGVTPERPAGTVPAALSAMAAYVPTESLGLFILGSAIVRPTGAGEKWLLVVLALVINLAYLWLQLTAHSRDRRVVEDKWTDRWIQWGLLALVSTLSLCVYMATIPGNAFAEWGLESWWAALLAIVIAVAVPPVAERLKLSPRGDAPRDYRTSADAPTTPVSYPS